VGFESLFAIVIVHVVYKDNDVSFLYLCICVLLFKPVWTCVDQLGIYIAWQ